MNAESAPARIAFADLLDLAEERVGGRALIANDEFFAAKENLLKPGRGIFIPDKFTDHGKWMDGWETRRRRTPGNDWCIIQLGIPGRIRGINVDTNHFIGNSPECCSLDGLRIEKPTSAEELARSVQWVELVPRSKLAGGTENFFAIDRREPWTHVRLNIFPDGGVARMRVHGEVIPDVERWRKSAETIDLAAADRGGTVVAANDAFFGPMHNLIMPGRAKTMGEGWETRRKRVPGFDWIVVKLAAAGFIKRVEVDTNHFKGNYPESCSLDGCYVEQAIVDFANAQLPWTEILPRVKLQGNFQNAFETELRAGGPFSYARLNIFPDGGVSRLRLYGVVQ